MTQELTETPQPPVASKRYGLVTQPDGIPAHA